MAKKGLILTILCCLVIVLATQTCQNKEQHLSENRLAYLNLHDSVDYVGMDMCAQCHSGHYSTFMHTGMGSSFDLASRRKSAASFGANHFVYDSILDYYYLPFFRGDSMFLREFRLDGRDTVFKKEEYINYIVGSGHHTNSHIMKRGDYLYQVPATFYTQSKRWDLPPGFESGNNSRFTRVLDDECMGCHNAHPKLKEHTTRQFENIGLGIDCERCHGPGELHVKMRSMGVAPKGKYDSTIVNPRNLTSSLLIDMCQRCHLQGNNVLKPGKRFSDFKPGMALSEVFEVYSPDYQGDNSLFNMANHSERMQMSKCFKQSNEALTCISCHNPHVSVRETNIIKFNEVCSGCHKNTCSEKEAVRFKLDNNCTECHMPPSGTEDIPHVTVHDHKIGIYPSGGSVMADSKIIGLRCVNNPNPSDEMMVKAYLSYYEKFDPSPIYREKAREILDKNKFPWMEVHYHFQSSNWESIISEVKHLKSQDAQGVDCYRLAKAYERTNNLNAAIEWMSLACLRSPDRYEYLSELGTIFMKSKMYAEARIQFSKCLKLNNYYIQALNNMAFLEMEEGRLAHAKQYLDRSMEQNPDYVPALENYARWMLLKEDVQGGIKYAKMIQKIEPNHKQATQLLKKYDER
jgi:predicted CXXCH cytochrome family protein